ncbi:hypothetical protein C359_00112 [Cryptococcus neoformans Bt120]|nr:hypothetical protein C360_00545 [Cryptococcus neoformans var. grubii Bt15]OXG45428.1 hypothetical protein C359_00112 [Cryptococcus neoformans var. grubii Bt120]
MSFPGQKSIFSTCPPQGLSSFKVTTLHAPPRLSSKVLRPSFSSAKPPKWEVALANKPLDLPERSCSACFLSSVGSSRPNRSILKEFAESHRPVRREVADWSDNAHWLFVSPGMTDDGQFASRTVLSRKKPSKLAISDYDRYQDEEDCRPPDVPWWDSAVSRATQWYKERCKASGFHNSSGWASHPKVAIVTEEDIDFALRNEYSFEDGEYAPVIVSRSATQHGSDIIRVVMEEECGSRSSATSSRPAAPNAHLIIHSEYASDSGAPTVHTRLALPSDPTLLSRTSPAVYALSDPEDTEAQQSMQSVINHAVEAFGKLGLNIIETRLKKANASQITRPPFSRAFLTNLAKLRKALRGQYPMHI